MEFLKMQVQNQLEAVSIALELSQVQNQWETGSMAVELLLQKKP